MNNVTHNAKGFRNRYCGPAALSALAGITAEEAAALLRKVSGKRSIMGVHNTKMREALFELGLAVEERNPVVPRFERQPTIKQWQRSKPSGRLLVAVTGHYIVVEGRKFWDNSNPEGAPLSKICRRRVKRVWVIKGRANKQVIRDIAKAKKATATHQERDFRS